MGFFLTPTMIEMKGFENISLDKFIRIKIMIKMEIGTQHLFTCSFNNDCIEAKKL